VLDRFAAFEALDRAFARYFADEDAEAAGAVPPLTLLRGGLERATCSSPSRRRGRLRRGDPEDD
jgi:hypothetical protein